MKQLAEHFAGAFDASEMLTQARAWSAINTGTANLDGQGVSHNPWQAGDEPINDLHMEIEEVLGDGDRVGHGADLHLDVDVGRLGDADRRVARAVSTGDIRAVPALD